VEQGDLACGIQGSGRMASMEAVLTAIEKALKTKSNR